MDDELSPLDMLFALIAGALAFLAAMQMLPW
jgi:hypothetical protein